jgi:hypothetical protein
MRRFAFAAAATAGFVAGWMACFVSGVVASKSGTAIGRAS